MRIVYILIDWMKSLNQNTASYLFIQKAAYTLKYS